MSDQPSIQPSVETNKAPSRLNQIANSIANTQSSSNNPTTSEPAVPRQDIPSNLVIIAKSISSNTVTMSQLSSSKGTGEEVFSCKDVQVYIIKPDQNVATRSNLVTLRIVTIPLEQQDLVSENPKPPAFLEAGSWVYPLIPNQSPVYRSSEGYYIFPDLSSNSPGASVGLVLSNSLDNDERETFEMMILNLCGLASFPNISPSSMFVNTGALISSAQDSQRSSEAPPSSSSKSAGLKIQSLNNSSRRGKKTKEELPLGPNTPNLCNKIAVGMMAVAEGASRGLSLGAMKTAELLDKGTEYVKGTFSPASEPTQIEPDIKDVVTVANTYSGQGVYLSNLLVSKLADATSALASYAAYHCQSTATDLVVKFGGQSESDTQCYLDGMLEISEGALNAVGMVYAGLHNAARTLANSITNNTIDVVEYCYGPDAGEIVEIAADTVGNITMVGLNVNSVKPKKVITRAARDTGRAILVKTSDPPELPNLNLDNIKL